MHIFKSYFPITNRCTYLNTAASGLLPEPVLEFRRTHDQQFFEGGSLFKERQGSYLETTREQVGQLFSCAPNRVALVPNFSYGFNTVLEGISSTKQVLLLEGDDPSVNWPFEARGFQIRYCPIDAQLEERIDDAFAKAAPAIFAFSVIQYISGIKINLDFIADLKQRYPDTLFLADGTQFFGTTPFDFDSSGIDILGGSCYKWMNAGYGNGIFLFKPDVAAYVAPKTTGFNALQGKYKAQEGSFIGHFEPGHQDTLNYGSLGAAITLINEFGLAQLSNQINELGNLAKAAFIERKLLEKAVVARTEHSSIFNLKGDDALIAKLRDANIICIKRGDGIRVSFHYYNTKEDLERLLAFL